MRRGIRGLTPLKPSQTLDDLGKQMKDEAARLADWTKRVGATRAQEALDVMRAKPSGSMGSTTLPELLAEAWLKKSGADYRAQWDLDWARPDFVIFQNGGVTVLEVDGDYWHANTGAKDAARDDRLLRSTIRGVPVRQVVRVKESDIYQSESAFSAVMA